MKTILGLIGGGSRDEIILRTALAAAVPFSAHLDFLHVHVSAGNAAKYDHHAQFAMGSGIGSALDNLETKAKTFSELASDNVREFCAASKIEICDSPIDSTNMTASFRVEHDTTIERLIYHAGQCDVVVLGRARQSQGLSPKTLERLVRGCARPVLVAANAPPQTLTGTVMVCWNNSDNVTHAVAAAMPILVKAKHVVFANVAKRNEGSIESMHDLVRQLALKEIKAKTQIIPMNRRGIPSLLEAAAEACGADLLVMGAYGQSRLRELIFGSRTEALIRNVDKPILLMH
jgi:nucleotide-binding universal stress UspA family protein